MQTQPLISIIMAAYNIEKWVGECIESVLAQTYTHWQLIAVDDGSTDKSGAVIDSFAAADKRIVPLHLQNGGLSTARNEGVKHAEGELIYFLDGDDRMLPEMLATLVKHMQDTDSDIVVCGYYDDYTDHRTQCPPCKGEPGTFEHNEALAKILRDEVNSAVWNKLLKRHTVVKEFPPNLYHEDHAVMAAYFAAAKRVTFIPDPLYLYRQRRGSIMNDNVNARRHHDVFIAEKMRYAVAEANGMHDIGVQQMVMRAYRCKQKLLKSSAPLGERQRYLREIIDEIRPLYAEGKRVLKPSKRRKMWLWLHLPITPAVVAMFSITRHKRSRKVKEEQLYN